MLIVSALNKKFEKLLRFSARPGLNWEFLTIRILDVEELTTIWRQRAATFGFEKILLLEAKKDQDEFAHGGKTGEDKILQGS